MALDHVAELARQAATDSGVFNALRNDPARIRAPLNLSEPQLRALISAGSFTTDRRAVTTSQAEPSFADQIAAMEVGTLFPPEGEGQFPSPGELPPTVVTPRSTPAAAPGFGVPTVATPSTGTPLSSTPARTPAVPAHSGAPQSVAPRSSGPGRSATPQSAGSTPTTSSGTPASSAGSSGSTAQQSQRSGAGGEIQLKTCGCGCDACATAMTSIVAAVTTTAQAAITAITAIAGFD